MPAAKQMEINNKISKAIHLLEEASADETQYLSQKMSDGFSDIKSNVMDWSQRSTDQVMTQAKRVDDTVRENPWKSVGIAAAAGAILGAFIVSRTK